MNRESTYLGVLKKLSPFIKKYKSIIFVSLFLTSLTSLISQISPLTIQFVVNTVSEAQSQKTSFEGVAVILVLAAALLLVKELVSLVTTVGQKYIGEKLKALIGGDLSLSAFGKLLHVPLDYYGRNENDVGKIIKRIDRGSETLAKTTRSLFTDIIPLLANASVALVVMYAANYKVGIISTLIVPIYFFLSLEQAKKQKGVRQDIQRGSEDRTSTIVHALSAIQLVKSFRKEKAELKRHELITQGLVKKEIEHHKTNNVFDSLKLFLEQIGAVMIVLFTAYLVIIGQAPLGAIMLHLLLYNNITAPIRSLHRIYDEMNEAVAFSGGFFDILEEKDEVDSLQNRGNDTKIINGDIVFKNVSFAYNDGAEILHSIDLELKAGETSALVGLSGAGKTTIANLIGRFFIPQKGAIFIDNKNISSYSLSNLRDNIAYVLQSSHIFPGTIRDNIAYGITNANDSGIIEAAKKAGLHDEIIKMRDGYQSLANQLSGGQKQRIAIARVFLKDPSFVILDEPTASLDAISAEKIKESLDKVRERRTVLIISHNLASIIDANIIYVVKEGRVIGKGTHEVLYNENQYYRDIIDTNIRLLNIDRLVAVKKTETK